MKIQFKRNQQASTASPGTLVAGEPIWFKDKLYIGSVGAGAGGSQPNAGDIVLVGPDDWPVRVYTTGFTTVAGKSSSPYRTAQITVTDPAVTEYKDGMIIAVRLPITGVSTAGLAIQINNLGFKGVVLNASTRHTNHYPAGSVVWLVYNASQTLGLYWDSATAATVTGTWQASAWYYSDSNSIAFQVRSSDRTRSVTSVCGRYRICFSSADNTQWVPANSSSSTSATAVKDIPQTPIDPFGEIIYYGDTTAVSAGNSLGTDKQWYAIACSLGYSFNTTGAALTMTFPAPVYVKCTPYTDGHAIIDSANPFVQSLPTTKDGKIYIYLGQAYSATSMYLTQTHPVFWCDGHGTRLWTGSEPPEKLSDLVDVSISSPEDGHVLAYSSSSQLWTNQPVDGGGF